MIMGEIDFTEGSSMLTATAATVHVYLSTRLYACAYSSAGTGVHRFSFKLHRAKIERAPAAPSRADDARLPAPQRCCIHSVRACSQQQQQRGQHHPVHCLALLVTLALTSSSRGRGSTANASPKSVMGASTAQLFLGRRTLQQRAAHSTLLHSLCAHALFPARRNNSAICKRRPRHLLQTQEIIYANILPARHA